MHRSGTSAVTRLVSLLGVALCPPDDLLAGYPANPRGHWESKSLVRFDDLLLRELDGGSWWCPPSRASDASRLLERYGARALATMRTAHPQRPFVWKDPRACLLLGFWSRVLARRAVYVVVARHPREVSDSLERRERFTAPYSVALWERYMRLALTGCAGRPTMLCTYDEVLADPLAWCERLAGFLRSLGMELPRVDDAPISAFVASSLRGARRSWSELAPVELFPPERIALVEAATRVGAHDAYAAPSLPGESPETEAIFMEIRRRISSRRLGAISAEPDQPVRPLSARRPEAGCPASVVLAGDSASSPVAIRAFADALPDGSEILLAGAQPIDARSLADVPILVRETGGTGEWNGAALARAVEAAAGRVTLVATTAPPENEAWYAQLEQALAHTGTGAVAAAIRLDDDLGRGYLGGAFVDAGLSRGLVASGRADARAPAPLLCGGLCAFDRRVLAAAGGVDAHFDSVSAALSELSLRLWRMCFGSYTMPKLEVRAQRDPLGSLDDHYDRLRIAVLHLDRARLHSFIERAEQWPSYDSLARRLAATDVQRRRALIDAICTLPTERYFDEFPLRDGLVRSGLRRARQAARAGSRRGRVLRLAALRLRFERG